VQAVSVARYINLCKGPPPDQDEDPNHSKFSDKGGI
jgi:hypothetical protein